MINTLVYTHYKFQFARKLLDGISLNPNASMKNKMLLFKAVFHTVILYACPVWGFARTITSIKYKPCKMLIFVLSRLPLPQLLL